MNKCKMILKRIRLAINRIGSRKRAGKIRKQNPTIISNNCYAGIVYEHLGIKFSSPTIGLYFYADEYIKFCKKFDYYIEKDLKFITYKESKYKNELIKRKEQNVVIGKLDDVEIVFLHYKNEKEAKEKWNRRCKRINRDCLIFKFCDQNLCTEKNIIDFDSLPYKNKFCFTAKEYKNLKSTIWFKCQNNREEVYRDYYIGHKYFNIVDFINTYDIREGKEKLKVLQIGMTYNFGGIEAYLINYYRKICQSNISFDFVNIYSENLCYSDEIKKYGGQIYNVSNYYKHPIKYICQIKKIINDKAYYIVHCNMNSAAMIYPLIAAKVSDAKIIISHAHNSASDRGLLKKILHNLNKRLITHLANNYFSCSVKAGEWFFSKKIMLSDKYKIIYNAIEIEKYKYNSDYRKEIRNELKISNDCFVIGHVGRFNKQKNHLVLIDIFHKVYQTNKKTKLLLIGDGPMLEKIKERIKHYGIEDAVIILGKRKDVYKLYNAMDLFVLPSLYEGLPLVGVEAQVNGLKCLFSRTIDSELSISEYCEYIPLDTEKWVTKINSFDGKRNHNYIDYEKFDINCNSQNLINIYMEGIFEYGKRE